MKIYELVHMHRAEVLSDGRFHCGDIAILGFFKSLDEVSTTIKFYKNIEGFRNYPNGFVVFEHEIEGDEASIYVAFFTCMMKNMNLNTAGISVYSHVRATLVML